MPDYPRVIPATAFGAISLPDRSRKKQTTLIVQRSVSTSPLQNERDRKYCGISALEIISAARIHRCSTSGDTVDAPIAADSDQRVRFAPLVEDVTIRWTFAHKEFIVSAAVELYRDVWGTAERVWAKNIVWKPGTCPETVETKFNGSLLKDRAPKSADAGNVSKGGATKATSVTIDEAFSAAQFPDGTLTIEHAPYLLRVVITDASMHRKPPSRCMFLDVVAKIVRLRWGTEEMIPDARVDALIDPVRVNAARAEEVLLLNSLRAQTANPALHLNHVLGGADFEIVLPVPVFKQLAGTQPEPDHSDFVETTKLWGNGPRLPVLAEVEIQKSDGTFAPSPKAVGKAKFLWDWRDQDNVVANPKWDAWVDAGISQMDQDFLTGLLAEHHDATDPLVSDNCPVALGGKRGAGADPVFPDQPGYDAAAVLQDKIFPFEVSNSLAVRKWGALTTAWRSGLLAGSTGALFQPSRIAGDKYKLTVFLYYDPALDYGTPTATLATNAKTGCISSGFLEVFRSLKVTCIKRGTIPALGWNAITALYKKELGLLLQIQNDVLNEIDYAAVLEDTIDEFNKDNNFVGPYKWIPLFFRFGLELPQPADSPAVAIKTRAQCETDVRQAFNDSKVFRLMIPGAGMGFKLENVFDTNNARGIVVRQDMDSIWVLATNAVAFAAGQQVKGRASGATADVGEVQLSCGEEDVVAGTRPTKREVRVSTAKGHVTFSFLPYQKKLDESTKRRLIRLLETSAADDPAVLLVTVAGPATGDDRARRNDVEEYVRSLFHLNTGVVCVKKRLLAEIGRTVLDNSAGPYDRYYYPAGESHGGVMDVLLTSTLRAYVERQRAYAGERGVYLFHMPGQDSSFNVKCTGGYFVNSSKRDRGIVQVAIWNGMGYLTQRPDGSVIAYKGDDSVAAHELGHALFVAHALHKTSRRAPPSPKPHHHIIGSTCIMNYDSDSDHFCAFCVLRMRGWDWERFKDVKFAITEVRLTDKAEAKRSKNYMPALEGYDAATVPGSDSFRFAPAKDAVRIRYKIFDPGKRIKSGTLTLKRVRDGQVLWSRPLQPNEWKEGDVSILWKGRVAGARAFFAKDYLTLEHSPYRLEVNVDGEGFGEPPLGWTQFEVRAKIQLEFGPRTVLAASAAQGTSAAQLGVVSGLERDHQVWEYLNGNELPPPYAYLPAPTVDNLAGRVPAEAETKRVYLVSNVFSSGVSQQISNAQFGEQRTAWAGAGGAGDFGPNIPVFVKVEVMDLSDAPVASPAAIGGAKVLWEWEDATAASDELGYIQETEDYLMSAENYDIATTTPPGRGCHADRGGKRGLPGCVVFPAQADPGTMNPGPRVFPFEVSHAVATNRTWAAASTINTAGPHSCKTGVIFQPSHIAGDAYKLRGYLYYPSELPLVNVADVDGPNHPKETIPKERQVTSGRFEIWHELHIPAYYKKKAGLIGGVGVSADIDLARVVDLFAPAFLRVRYLQVWDAVGLRFVAFQAMVQATYDNALNQLVVNALALVPPPNSLPWFIASAIDQPNNNWAQGNYVFHYKTHAQYRLALEARGMPVTALAPPIDLDPIDPNTQAWDDRYYADDNYYKRMANLHYSRRMLIHLVEAYIGANPRDGVYLFQADGFSQFGDAYCNAASACFLPHNPHRAPFFSVKGNFSCTIEETCAHEIGHVLFLNHIEPGDQNPWKFHASAGGSCLMSYNFMPPRSLCASCLLRLRGWSLYRVNPNGTTHEPALLARNPDTGRTLGLNPADNPVTSPNTITVTKYI